MKSLSDKYINAVCNYFPKEKHPSIKKDLEQKFSYETDQKRLVHLFYELGSPVNTASNYLEKTLFSLSKPAYLEYRNIIRRFMMTISFFSILFSSIFSFSTYRSIMISSCFIFSLFVFSISFIAITVGFVIADKKKTFETIDWEISEI